MPERRPAAIAFGLALATIGWAQFSGALHDGHAGTYSLRVAAVVLAWAVGTFIGRSSRALAAACVIVTVGLSFALSPNSLSGGALAPPLHYGNADGAFAAAAVAAGTLLFVLPVQPALRVVGATAALGFLVVCAETRSMAAFIAATITLVAGALARVASARQRRILLLTAPVLVVAAAAFTVVVGASFQRGHAEQPAVVRLADHALSERRAALWHDALVIARDHPVSGVGPGEFASASPTARSDADARWAHSAWLQQLADQGLVGLVLFAGAIGMGWWALVRRRDDAAAVVGSWALGGLLLQASIDYVLDFIAVPVVVALLAGASCVITKEKSALALFFFRDQRKLARQEGHGRKGPSQPRLRRTTATSAAVSHDDNVTSRQP